MRLAHLFESKGVIDCMAQPFYFGAFLAVLTPPSSPHSIRLPPHARAKFALRIPGDGNAYQDDSVYAFDSGETAATHPENYGPQKIGILKMLINHIVIKDRFTISPELDPHGAIENNLETQYAFLVKTFNNLVYQYYKAHIDGSGDEDEYDDELDEAHDCMKMIISILSNDLHLTHATIFGKQSVASSMKLIEHGVKEYVHDYAVHSHNMEKHIDTLTSKEEGQAWDSLNNLERFESEHTYNEKASELYYEKWKRIQFEPFIKNNADIQQAVFFFAPEKYEMDFSFFAITNVLYLPNPEKFSKPIAEQIRKDFTQLEAMLLKSFKAMEKECKESNAILRLNGSSRDVKKVLTSVGYSGSLAKYLKQYAADLVAEYAAPETATRFSSAALIKIKNDNGWGDLVALTAEKNFINEVERGTK